MMVDLWKKYFLIFLLSLYSFLPSLGFCEDCLDVGFSPNPLINVQVGQWATYRIGGDSLQRSSIIDLTMNNEVLIRVEQQIDGNFETIAENWTTVEKLCESRKNILQNSSNYTIDCYDLEISNKIIPVKSISMQLPSGKKRIIVVSDEVPIYGEVKIEIEEMPFPVSELLDFEF